MIEVKKHSGIKSIGKNEYNIPMYEIVCPFCDTVVVAMKNNIRHTGRNCKCGASLFEDRAELLSNHKKYKNGRIRYTDTINNIARVSGFQTSIKIKICVAVMMGETSKVIADLYGCSMDTINVNMMEWLKDTHIKDESVKILNDTQKGLKIMKLNSEIGVLMGKE